MNTTPQSLLADLQQRVSDLFRNSPAADIERNLKAMLAQTFQRVDLVTRDEFDTQIERLSRLQERIALLEQRLAERQMGEAAQPGGAYGGSGATAAGAGTAGATGAASGADAIPMPGPSPDDAGPVI